MSGANARDGRRRRMLQDASREMAAHGNDETKSDSAGEEYSSASSEGRRYAFVEGSLGGALARRHFPNHVLAPLGCAAAGVASVAGIATLHVYRESVNVATGGCFAALIDIQSPTSIASWLASSCMLVTALLAFAILAVRRRRVDDYRGRHRLWRGAAFAAGTLSLAATTQFHTAMSQAVSNASGVRLLAGGAEWWLAGAALLFGWVGVRVLLDVKESRLALAIYVLAVVAGGTALLAHLVGLPITAVNNAVVVAASQLASYVLMTVALIAYTRFLRRDVAAGVATKPQKTRSTESKSVKLAKQTRKEKTASQQPMTDTPSEQTTSPAKRKQAAKKQQAAKAQQDEPAITKWTDGSDGGDEQYDDEGQPRKLSKSERKRLRKLKAERRAA